MFKILSAENRLSNVFREIKKKMGRGHVWQVFILLMICSSAPTGCVAQTSDPLIWSPVWETESSFAATYHGYIVGYSALSNRMEYYLIAIFADGKEVKVFSRPNAGGFNQDLWVYNALRNFASGDNEAAFWASYEACIVDGGYNANTWRLLAALSHLTGRDSVVEMAVAAVGEIEEGQIGEKSGNLVRLVEPLEYAKDPYQYVHLQEFQTRMHNNARPAPSKPVMSLGGPLPSYELERQQLLDIFEEIAVPRILPFSTYMHQPHLTNVFYSEGKYDEAIPSYGEALRLDPDIVDNPYLENALRAREEIT